MSVLSRMARPPGVEFYEQVPKPEGRSRDQILARLFQGPISLKLLENISEETTVREFIELSAKELADTKVTGSCRTSSEASRKQELKHELSVWCDEAILDQSFLTFCREQISEKSFSTYFSYFEKSVKLTDGRTNEFQSSLSALQASKVAFMRSIQEFIFSEGLKADALEGSSLVKDVDFLDASYLAQKVVQLQLDMSIFYNNVSWCLENPAEENEALLSSSQSSALNATLNDLATSEQSGGFKPEIQMKKWLSSVVKGILNEHLQVKVLYRLPIGFVKKLKPECFGPSMEPLDLFREHLVLNKMLDHATAILQGYDTIQQIEDYYYPDLAKFFKGTSEKAKQGAAILSSLKKAKAKLHLGKKISEYTNIIERLKQSKSYVTTRENIQEFLKQNPYIGLKEYNTLTAILSQYREQEREALLECQKLSVRLLQFCTDCKCHMNVVSRGIFGVAAFSSVLRDLDCFDSGFENTLRHDDKLQDYLQALSDVEDLKRRERKGNTYKEVELGDSEPKSDVKEVADVAQKEATLAAPERPSLGENVTLDLKGGKLSAFASRFVSFKPKAVAAQKDLEFHTAQVFSTFQEIMTLALTGKADGMLVNVQKFLHSMSVALEINGQQHNMQWTTVERNRLVEELTHDLNDIYPPFPDPSLNVFVKDLKKASLATRYPAGFHLVESFSEDQASLVTKLLGEQLPQWKNLTSKKKQEYLEDVTNALHSFLQVMGGSWQDFEAVKNYTEKVREMAVQAVENNSASASEVETDKIRLCHELKAKFETLLRRYQGRSCMSTTCLKNILFQVSLMLDGLKSGQGLNKHVTEALVLPFIDRATELTLELMTARVGKKLRSHDLREYQKALESRLSTKALDSLNQLLTFNFGNHSHYLHREFGRKGTVGRQNFESYRKVASSLVGIHSSGQATEKELAVLSDGCQKSLENLMVLVDEVPRLAGKVAPSVPELTTACGNLRV